MATQEFSQNPSQVYPPHFNLESVVRPNILALHPYRCARDDYSEGILLDANENALGHAIASQVLSDNETHAAVEETLALPLHRYPDPIHLPIKERIATLRSLPAPQNVFLGVGSDEVLDLLIRIFVKPGISNTGNDKILITPPTYGMYSVCAQVNDVGLVKVPLRVREEEIGGAEGGKTGRFSVDVEAVKKAVFREQRELGNTIKIIFLCSPGNPTGTLIDLEAVKELLEWDEFKGVIVIDEAYIDFAGAAEDADPDAEIYKRSAAQFIGKYDNVVITQTLSKSFGLAGIRLGIALAPVPIVQILSNTKAPYNVSLPTAHLASKALTPDSLDLWRANVRTLKHNRASLISSLTSLAQSTLPDGSSLGVGPIIGSNDANFVVVRILERGTKPSEVRADSVRAQKVYKYLAEEVGVVVRYRGNELGCEGCLRITVGTEQESKTVLEKLVGVLEKI